MSVARKDNPKRSRSASLAVTDEQIKMMACGIVSALLTELKPTQHHEQPKKVVKETAKDKSARNGSPSVRGTHANYNKTKMIQARISREKIEELRHRHQQSQY